MSRTVARETAFKIVFEKAFQPDDLQSLYERYKSSQDENLDINIDDEKYIIDVLTGINSNIEKIDEKIKAHLKDWVFERVSKIDLAILRLAIYEICFKEDIPTKVSINEAIEIAKQYSEDTSSAFVNGILAEIIKEQ